VTSNIQRYQQNPSTSPALENKIDSNASGNNFESSQLFCLPVAESLSTKPSLSLRKPGVCADLDCRSKGCRPQSANNTIEDNDCESCEEIETDESSLEETIETLNEVLDLGEGASSGATKRARKLTPKQETKKVSGQIKDASALKSFAYGNYFYYRYSHCLLTFICY